MNLTQVQLTQLHDIACDVAREAGELIRGYADNQPDVRHKDNGGSLAMQVVTEVDLKCDALIREKLMPSSKEFDLAILTEETEDDHSRLEKAYFWCVDPLDGTLAFTRSRHGYAVSIALITKAGEPVVGVAYDPLKDILYSACKGQGAWRNGRAWQPDIQARADAFVVPLDCSFIERPGFSDYWARIKQWVEAQGYGSVQRLDHGGAVLSALWVLENGLGCYFKPPKDKDGGGSIWDFAAIACIYHEFGAYARDFHGQPLKLNPRGSTYMNERGVCFASHARLHALTQYVGAERR